MKDSRKTASLKTEEPYRWIMLALGWLLYMVFGVVLVSLSPLVAEIRQDLSISNTSMGALLGAWSPVAAAISIWAGNLIDRVGLRVSMGVGISIVAASAVLRAVPSNYAFLFFAVALFGIGCPFVSIGGQKLIVVWFGQASRKTASGIYVTAPTVAFIAVLGTTPTVLLPLVGYWRGVLALFAAVAVGAAVAWWSLSREPDRLLSEDSDYDPELQKAAAHLLKNPLVLRVVLLAFGIWVTVHTMISWLPDLLRSDGLSNAQAGLWAAFPFAVSVIGALAIPRIVRPDMRWLVLLVFSLGMAVSVALIGLGSGVILKIGLAIFGVPITAGVSLLMLILMDTPDVGRHRLGQAAGWVFGMGWGVAFVGPLAMGILLDLTGGFTGGIMALITLNIGMAVVAANLRTPLMISANVPQ